MDKVTLSLSKKSLSFDFDFLNFLFSNGATKIEYQEHAKPPRGLNDLAGDDVLLVGDADPDMMLKVRETIDTTISGLESIEQTMESVLKCPDDMPVDVAMLVLQTTFVMKQNLVYLKDLMERDNVFSENDLSRLNLVIQSMNILDAYMKGNIDEGPVNDAKDVLKSALPPNQG